VRRASGATGLESLLRVRIGHDEAHYAGNLVDGARLLALFGDVATELCILSDGEEGLFCAYASVEFLAPVRGGDYVEARGRIVRSGRSSREMEFTAHKVIETDPSRPGRARRLDPPVLVGRARGTCVVGR
jgi:3-aminobutyryl-CoA ammonia-lyase